MAAARRPHAAPRADAGLRGVRRPRHPRRSSATATATSSRTSSACPGLAARGDRALLRARGCCMNVIASMDLQRPAGALGGAAARGLQGSDVTGSFFREEVSDESQSKSITIWTFAITSVALFMVTLDNLVVTTALPVIREDLHASPREPRVDGQRLHAHLRGPAPDRARRSATASGGGACSRSGSPSSPSPPPPPRSRRRCARSIAARAVQGVGGAIVTPLTLTILVRGSAGGAPRRSRSAPGAGSAASPSRSARSSAARSSAASRGTGSSGSTSRSGSCSIPLALLRLDETHGPDGEARPARPRPRRAPACSGSSGASCAGTASRLERARRSSARSSPARVLVALFVALGAARAGADAADALLPQPHVRARERRVALHVLRDVRLDLPARAVLPDRAGLLAAQARACASSRGRRCRSSSRRSPARSPTASAAQRLMGTGPRAAGDRARAGSRRSRRRRSPYIELVAPFVLSGIGMALFFAPVANVVLSVGAAGGGGPGVGREQRDPRARRRVRRRGPRVGLRRTTAATRAASVRRRHACRRSGSARPSSPSAPSRRS